MPEVIDDALSRPEVVYLVATSGHPHYGDEVVTAAWLRHLARARPDATVVLDCPQPGLASFLFEGLHPRLITTDILFRVVWETRDRDPAEADAHVDRLLEHLGSPRYDLGLLAARRATQVHVTGGGHVTALWPFHVRLLRAALRLRDICGARAVATGLGLTPVAEPAAVRAYLQAFDHATVRDGESAAIAAVAQSGEDAVLALSDMPGFQERPPSRRGAADGDVWVCLQHDLVEETAFDAMVAAARAVLESDACRGRTVRYFEAMPGADRIAYDRLSDLIPAENFVPFVRLWHEPFPARPGQTWLTSRYHLHLLAAACGAEGTAFAVDDDTSRPQHESLLAAGTGWGLTVTGARQPAPPALGPDFRLLAARLHADKRGEAQRLYPDPV